MERNDLHGLDNALGIQQPWAIKSVKVNEQEKLYEVALELHDKKRLFGFFDSGKKETQDDLLVGRWRYINVGTFGSVIRAFVPRSIVSDNAFLNRDLIGLQAYLGHPERQYSNFLRQQVALAQLKGIDLSSVTDAYRVSEATLKAICDDLGQSAANTRALAFLPTEIDGVWDRVLADQLILRTNILPLKFLLSKLKLAAAKTIDPTELHMLKLELRKFFIEHNAQMEHEFEQVCGVSSARMQQQVRAASRQRLILPALKSPVWLDLLSGKLSLNSQSIPLNLLLSRQRSAFVQGHTKDEKVQAINTIRDYFRKNYRTLKAELLLLNRAMEIRQKSVKASVALPDVEHKVWQKILEDDTFVPSNHVAYKLLLAKLRAQVTTRPDPVIKMEAARRIRDFLRQNQRTMRNEVGVLLKQIAAV